MLRSGAALLGNGMVVLERGTEREPWSRVPGDGTEFLKPPRVVADVGTGGHAQLHTTARAPCVAQAERRARRKLNISQPPLIALVGISSQVPLKRYLEPHPPVR